MRCTPWTLMLVSASLCFAAFARGQTDLATKNHPAPQVTGAAAVSSSPPRELLVAEIVFVGNIENAARLAHELGELLSARGFAPRFQQRVALSENELATQQLPNDPSRGTVWILVPYASLARLVFADPTHMRFLIRDIPLPQGMDDVGRESVEQVVESSFLALLQGAPAVGRADAHAALAPYVIPAPTAAPTEAQRAPQPDVPPPIRPPSSSPALPRPLSSTQPAAPPPPRYLTQRLGIGYGTGWSGGDFGVEHGPEFLAGIELLRQTDSLYVAGTFDWHLAQHHRTSEFDLSVQNTRIGLVFGWRKPISSPISLIATIGPGVGVTRAHSVAQANVSAARPDSTSVFSWARFQSGFEWGSSPVAVQLVLRADVSFDDTYFAINRNGVTETLAHAWLLRPGVALGALWR